MKLCKSISKILLSFCLILSMVISLAISSAPVMAEKASPDVQTKINGLLTSFVPNVTETKTVTSTMTFTHPGIILTKAMLDTIQNHVRSGDEPWASAFVKFSGYGKSSKTPLMRVNINDTAPFDIPGGGIGTEGYYAVRNMAQDADTAYVQTMMWYVTGDETYRKNAIGLIRRWVDVQSIGSIFDEQIRVSLAVFKFSIAADILRNSASNTTPYNWSSTDTTNFTNYLTLMKSKYDRYWHFMNQHGMNAMGTIASAVFRNDAADYAVAVKRATTNPELGDNWDFYSPTGGHNRDGSIKGQIRELTKNVVTGATVPANIQVVEMGRDQGHPYTTIGALSSVALTSYIQGTQVDPTLGTVSTATNAVNLFNFLNNRLLAGANYLTKYNLGNDVTYIPCYETDGKIWSAPTTGDRGKIDPTIGILYSYYKYIEKRADMDTNENTKYLSQAFTQIYPEGASQDFMGDGVLLFTTAPVIRLQSHNFSTRYLRHAAYRARIDANVSPVADAQFRIVAGLTDSKGYSFESVNFPGRYLTVRSNGEVWLDVNDNTSTYKNNATFRRVPGLADATKYSYQMWTDSSRYLRHANDLMYAQSGSGAVFNGDATFGEVAP
ncbi:AbfB domain-containing protein [Paenibacillus sedimenti]|uniref:AbfB domain-containing protein n=1 Tax=Paenibacillus sedimenti TaxID=2770274 RepID=A0A926KTB7_9BACL|nr:AbfB domain-containing protein [Paenibacillus sedimenti]MBD0381863.1 AbfB domain-containing protein [Paenibacillus sedimenti]